MALSIDDILALIDSNSFGDYYWQGYYANVLSVEDESTFREKTKQALLKEGNTLEEITDFFKGKQPKRGVESQDSETNEDDSLPDEISVMLPNGERHVFITNSNAMNLKLLRNQENCYAYWDPQALEGQGNPLPDDCLKRLETSFDRVCETFRGLRKDASEGYPRANISYYSERVREENVEPSAKFTDIFYTHEVTIQGRTEERLLGFCLEGVDSYNQKCKVYIFSCHEHLHQWHGKAFDVELYVPLVLPSEDFLDSTCNL